MSELHHTGYNEWKELDYILRTYHVILKRVFPKILSIIYKTANKSANYVL